MKSYNSVSLLSRSCTYRVFIIVPLICGAYFICSRWLETDSLRLSRVQDIAVNDTRQVPQVDRCNDKCKPVGSEGLPKGIVSATSNLEMQSLSGPVNKPKPRTSLLAMAVGIKQKRNVDEIVKKFLNASVTVMLFHYDGLVNQWQDLGWNDRVLHVSAKTQTKWWFAKRFLHPDIVADYEYIFLWDEDLGVENFHPRNYLSIIKEEGLEVSQPALDQPHPSDIHHQITVRSMRSRIHRRYFRNGSCDANNISPPCAGFVEMMAPVFSRAAWRCVWYMIQNDLIHAWGLDFQLGYCAQGDRTNKVGVVDEEYVVHLAIPSLGDPSDQNKIQTSTDSPHDPLKDLPRPSVHNPDQRLAVRMKSYREMNAFRNRWQKAVKEDECWIDPYEQAAKKKAN